MIIQTLIIQIQQVNKIKIHFQNAVSFLVIIIQCVYVQAASLHTCKSELDEKLLHIIVYFLNHLISKIFAVEKKKVLSQHILCNFSSPVLNLLTPK